jgi:hypothetical protein
VAIVGSPKIKLNSGGGPAENAVPSAGVGQGAVGDKAKEPKDPAGADSSKSGRKSRK